MVGNMMTVFNARLKLKFKTYIRYPFNLFFPFVEPLIWLTPVYFMYKAFSQGGTATGFAAYSGNNDFMGFAVVGYVISIYTNTSLWGTGLAIKDEMMKGTLEANWATPANRMTFLVGSASFQFIIATLEAIVTMTVCHFTFGFNISGSFLKAILFLIPCIIGLIGLGIGVSALVLLTKNANSIIDLSSSLLMGLSGSLFPVKVFPGLLLFIAYMIPVTFMNDGLRYFMLKQITLIPIKYEVMIVITSLFLLCFGGRAIFNVIDKRCRINGSYTGH
jgi:ABC-2 type transport system permease protein